MLLLTWRRNVDRVMRKGLLIRIAELLTEMDRQPWDVWEAAGSRTATDRIRAKLKKILARHAPPLPEGAAEKIEAILREAEARPENT
jgi:trimethylamine:corrinoid methyltransferase-like protein